MLLGLELAADLGERVSHLVLLGTYARGWLLRELTEEKAEEERLWISLMKIGWGQDNPAFRQFFTAQLIPDGTKEQLDSLNDMMPTLVLHARRDCCAPFEEG